MLDKVYFVPHPPLAVHAVGQGNERRIQATLEGYHKIAKEIGSYKPEIVLYMTPHGNSFRDALAFLDQESVQGDFGMFGYGGVGESMSIDAALTKTLIATLKESGISSVSLGQDNPYQADVSLDHGVLVPMAFIHKYYKDYKIVHITTSFQGPEVHFNAGQVLGQVLRQDPRKIVVVASGDLSHALVEEGPYKYNPYGAVFDGILKKAIETANPIDMLALNEEQIESAAQCGLGSFSMAFGMMDGHRPMGEVFSYEGPFGVGYLTGVLRGV